MSKPTLPRTERLHLDAAEGWIGLGNHAEAKAELEKIAPKLQKHPAVLKARWGALALAKDWETALEFASAIIQASPEDPEGWVNRSYALHELKRTPEARDNLLRVVEKFPTSTTIRYNLACYECRLGRLERAKQWLEKACELSDPASIRKVAREDLDLEPLWKDIG